MRTTQLTTTALATMIILALVCTPVASADNGWDSGSPSKHSQVDVSASGGSARVGASVGGSSGGGVVPAANGEYVSYPDGPVGENAPAVPTQICRLVHAGEIDFSTNQKSITVCYEPTTLTTPTTEAPTRAELFDDETVISPPFPPLPPDQSGLVFASRVIAKGRTALMSDVTAISRRHCMIQPLYTADRRSSTTRQCHF